MADLENWEGVKENIQPVSCGRDPNILSKFGANERNLVEDKTILQEKQREWESQLEEALRYPDTLDLAAVWRNYWKWIQQHYPTGHPNSLEFLERATKSLSSEQKYKNNIHALKIWISYADNSCDPLPIFEYMYANEIGTAFSLFYEAYALVLEKNRKFAESDRIYTEGIHRRASPIERLEKRHQEFQHRMVRRMQREEEGKSSSKSGNKQNRTDNSLRQPLNALDKKPLFLRNGSVENSRKNSNFEIYQDDDQQENTVPSSYPHMPRMTLVAKENEGNVDIWKGRRLPQKPMSKENSFSVNNNRFEIFEDELLDTTERGSSVEKSVRGKQNARTPLVPSERTETIARRADETRSMDKSLPCSQPRMPSIFDVNNETKSFGAHKHLQTKDTKGRGAEVQGSLVCGSHKETDIEIGDENQNDNLSDNGDIGCDNNLNVSSPTIHTKMALADVEAMFDSTLTFDRNLRLYNEESVPNEENDTLSFAATGSCQLDKEHNEAFTIYEDPQ